MNDKNRSYLEERIQASIDQKQDQVIFSFQKETIKLDQVAEINFLSSIDDVVNRQIDMGQDELKMTYQIKAGSYYNNDCEGLTRKERSVVGYQLIDKIKHHHMSRLHLVISPENLVISKGLSPYFLHYGVKESLPPYEIDHEQCLLETKAMLAYLVDPTFTFERYLKHYQTIKLSKVAKDIFSANTWSDLETILEQVMKQEDQQADKIKHVPIKKWKGYRYGLWLTIILLIPVLIYSFYSIFIIGPRQANITDAHSRFLNQSYSEVVSTLQSYQMHQLPKVTQYQLAYAYVMTESLTEDQRQNIRNTITPQSDPLYYEYWINIGRGASEEALETARFIEDRDLILYALIKQRELIRADQSLASDERQQQLNEIETEIDAYQREIEEQQESSNELDPEQEMTEDESS
ncbi:type VII secretion protein EssB [Amphibacillus cookii]|uniref:type VII secretion protein EssB n=1 Tax=Amphibacillus cookii TaxID=767787 RepID=UPI00195E0A77|nr:type VII secretion protein EssB [Amphibacillus cookii]MBM7542014.1 type VII secretion protein EssB [Amphibacillus cookii]